MELKGNYYDSKKRAAFMIKQEIAAKPRTLEYLRLKVLMEFGFGQKFVMEVIELQGGLIIEKNGVFSWKA